MADEPFYAPNRRPPPPRVARPGEAIWSILVSHVTWSCELRFHGESVGWEAQILRDGDLVIARTFTVRAVAEAWALGERGDIERGWVDVED
jgi:hypothetical protein